jgi:hypothetical protein
MRVFGRFSSAFLLFALSGCAQLLPEDGGALVRSQFAKCGAENKASPEGRILGGRLVMGDNSDSPAKLLDPYPLTPAERAALVQVHNKAVQCRQIIIAHAAQSASWQVPYLQEYASRSEQVFGKLESGELPVGMANTLSLESDRKLRDDLADARALKNALQNTDHPEGVRTQEAQRQRTTEELLAQSSQIAAAQTAPRMPSTYCSWQGNNLNCATLTNLRTY